MLNMRYLVFLLFFCLSCKKDKTSDIVSEDTPQLSIWGEFRLLSAKMYIDNHETGQKTVYDHFGPGRSVSSLNYEGSVFDIENIAEGITRYSFYKPLITPNSGVFLLNDDSTRVYGLSDYGGHYTITENPLSSTPGELLMGGSARPIQFRTEDYSNKIVVIRIQETEASIGGYNIRYFTELYFKKIR